MNPKLKIVCLGQATYVELDGKTMGTGIESIDFQHTGGDAAKLSLTVDLKNFSFMPDGYINRVEQMVKETTPPEEKLSGRMV